ncbi:MAG: hypothetical protein EBX52_09610 [Proteobacteria bacterium]|nr:hypothetical protein [Pseudomonadota bacterium]
MTCRDISEGDIVRPRFTNSFQSGTSGAYTVTELDVGLVTFVQHLKGHSDVLCLFKDRQSWWQSDELEIVSDRE